MRWQWSLMFVAAVLAAAAWLAAVRAAPPDSDEYVV